MTAPGTARPGGRTARVAESVFAAAIAELSARDYADISVESIAARAGVHKTTVYRRWGSKAEIISQALAGAASAGIPVPDAGSAEEDVRTLARAVQAVLSAARGGRDYQGARRRRPDFPGDRRGDEPVLGRRSRRSA